MTMTILIIGVMMVLFGPYVVIDLITRKNLHMPRHKYAALSEPARRIIKVNSKLPVEWRVDELWLYSTLSGMDERLTVDQVNKYHRRNGFESTYFSWTAPSLNNAPGEFKKYYQLFTKIEGIEKSLEAMEADERLARTMHAAEDMESIIDKLNTNHQIIQETRQEFKKLK